MYNLQSLTLCLFCFSFAVQLIIDHVSVLYFSFSVQLTIIDHVSVLCFSFTVQPTVIDHVFVLCFSFAVKLNNN